jgi:hypothetical protein
MSDHEKHDPFINKVKRVLASSLIFFTAFVLSSTLLQCLIALFCKALGYTVSVTYNVVHVQPIDPRYWSKARVAFGYALPPVVCLIIGLFMLSYLSRQRGEIDLSRIFRAWFMFCLINLFLGSLFISPIGLYSNRIMGFYQTFAVLGSWMGFNVPLMSVLAVISIIGSLAFGAFARNEVLKFSHSSREIKRSSGKGSTIVQLFILPMIVATIPIVSICTKDYIFPTMFMLINFMIIAVGMFTRSIYDNSTVRCGKHDALNRWPVFELVLAGGVWAGIFFYFK